MPRTMEAMPRLPPPTESIDDWVDKLPPMPAPDWSMLALRTDFQELLRDLQNQIVKTFYDVIKVTPLSQTFGQGFLCTFLKFFSKKPFPGILS